jgi:Ca-activated chloride channel family protein
VPSDWDDEYMLEDENYVKVAVGNEVTFKAPPLSARYLPIDLEVRYFSKANGVAIARQDVTVVSPEVSLKAPSTMSGGEAAHVEFSGRGDGQDILFWAKPNEPEHHYLRDDLIEEYIVPDIKDGSPVLVVAPAQAGEYEVRFYNDRRGGLLARYPVTVTAPKVSLDVPEEVKQGEQFDVVFSGPEAPGDIIFLALTDWDETSIPISKRERYPAKGSVVTLRAPDAGQSFEIRYYSWWNRVVLARRPLAVN